MEKRASKGFAIDWFALYKDSTILQVVSHLITKPKQSCWFRLYYYNYYIWFQRPFWVWIFIPLFFNKYSRQDFLHPLFIISSILRFFLMAKNWELLFSKTFIYFYYYSKRSLVSIEHYVVRVRSTVKILETCLCDLGHHD